MFSSVFECFNLTLGSAPFEYAPLQPAFHFSTNFGSVNLSTKSSREGEFLHAPPLLTADRFVVYRLRSSFLLSLFFLAVSSL